MENIELNNIPDKQLDLSADAESNILAMFEKTQIQEIPRDDLEMVIQQVKVNPDFQEECIEACNMRLA